jgi:biotin transporter BioY
MQSISYKQPSYFLFLMQSPAMRQLSLVMLGTLLVIVGAKINIPVQPIPVTLQSFAVLFIGMMLGFRRALFAVLIYLGIALAGFSIHGDLKTNAGYLLGIFLAVGLTGFLAERGWSRHFFSAMVAALLGSMIILLSGWIGLIQWMDGFAAFHVGVKPFLLTDVLKIIFLAVFIPIFWRFSEKK